MDRGESSGMMRKLKRALKRFFYRKKASRRVPIFVMERRRFPRVPSRNLIRILRRDSLKLDHLFNLGDFSENGLRVRTDLDAGPGSVIEAVVNFREMNYELPLRLRVVWAHKSRHGLAWGGQMGTQIIWYPENGRFLLKQLVYEKMTRMRAA